MIGRRPTPVNEEKRISTCAIRMPAAPAPGPRLYHRRAMDPTPADTPHVACLCAAWCRLCEGYRPVFEQAIAALGAQGVAVHAHWIDIEDEADLLGDFDVETFPTLVVADGRRVRFAGSITPQPGTLQRLLRATLQAGGPGAEPQPAEVLDFAARLRRRAPDSGA
jgi:thioredoxin 1